ncbi:MAG: superoxide dismutase, partial [Bacteroidales bacterium]|nr:superoxide dismutase [Bacteroidales bacterium]
MFTLIELPYAPDALEPFISSQTLSFHHGKHLQTYVDNLNKLLPGSGFEDLPLEEIVRRASAGPIFNNAGQILNHNLYFTQFRPFGKPQDDKERVIPSDNVILSEAKNLSSAVILSEAKNLSTQIISQWGTLAAFKADFEAKGAGLFGSGWVWLAAAPDGSLQITQEPGAGNPVTRGLKPLLTFDVWEHAYYLDYQNRRAAHL